MAHEWVIADKTFQSQLDESFVAHQYIIAAAGRLERQLPTGDWGGGGGKSTPSTRSSATAIRTVRTYTLAYDYQTLGDELDKAKLSWRFYASAFGALERSGCGVVELSGGQTHPLTGPTGR